MTIGNNHETKKKLCGVNTFEGMAANFWNWPVLAYN